MQFLTRKPGEELVIDGVTVRILSSNDNQVRLAIDAPDRHTVRRQPADNHRFDEREIEELALVG